MLANCRLGFTTKKIEAIPIAGDDLGFRFFHPRPPCGGMCAFAFARRARQAAQFSFSALATLGLVNVFYSDMRQQVPKPMFVFAYEGEPIAFIANGDRLV